MLLLLMLEALGEVEEIPSTHFGDRRVGASMQSIGDPVELCGQPAPDLIILFDSRDCGHFVGHCHSPLAA